MVRFIIGDKALAEAKNWLFTFQYGQIYYRPLINKDFLKVKYLHSNMVRFIIKVGQNIEIDPETFTFQYGQIYYLIFNLNLHRF